jgi:predicted phosphoribosyltransferase
MTEDRVFADRREAGEALAETLLDWFRARPTLDDPLVLALPRGGVAVAEPVARALGAPLDIVIVRKLVSPRAPELALGAIVDGPGPTVARNEAVIARLGVGGAALASLSAEALAEIDRRRRVWRKGRPARAVAGRDLVVVDDGAATGATAAAALAALRRRAPRTLLFAAPTASAEALRRIREIADATVTLVPLEPFHAVGARYAEFPQLSDADVSDALRRAARPSPTRG